MIHNQMHDMVIRSREAKDEAELLDVLARCAAATGYFATSSGELIAEARFMLQDPDFEKAWVSEAVSTAALTGHVAVMRLEDNEDERFAPLWTEALGVDPAKIMLLKRLFVDPQCQGRGVARALMATACGYIERSGRIPVLDTASTAEAAMRLYTGLGWREIARFDVSWSPDPDIKAVLFVPPGY